MSVKLITFLSPSTILTRLCYATMPWIWPNGRKVLSHSIFQYQTVPSCVQLFHCVCFYPEAVFLSHSYSMDLPVSSLPSVSPWVLRVLWEGAGPVRTCGFFPLTWKQPNVRLLSRWASPGLHRAPRPLLLFSSKTTNTWACVNTF